MEIITTHLNADFDAMASMVAAKKLYPKALMVFPGSQEKNLREFLSKTLPSGITFHRIRDIDLDTVTRMILVDIKIQGRLGPLDAVAAREDVELIIYDHHPATDRDYSGKIEIQDSVGATTTLLIEEIRKRRKKITPAEATLMAHGIYEDTGSLTFSSTTPRDLNAVAFLLKKGAKLDLVPSSIRRDLDAKQVQLLNDLLNSLDIHDIHGLHVAITVGSSEEYLGELALLVHQIMEMEQLDVLFTLARMEERVVLVCRSRVPEVDVGKIAEEFGGGGHPTAASASIRELTLVQVKEELLKLLARVIGEKFNAGAIMSAPVLDIAPDAPISAAAEMMSRFNINSLPVNSGDGDLEGIITRGVVERAILHHLSGSPVREYMLTEFQWVNEEAPLELVQEYIIEKHQRMLPVMDERKIIGVITRTDLLEAMHEDFKRTRAYEDFKGIEAAGTERARNIRELMKETLSERTLNVLVVAGEVSESMGFRAYLVGGLVRDIILRNKNQDVDLVVEGDGIEFGHRLASRLKARIRTHRKFQTAVLIMERGFKMDVATARTEYYEFPGAYPMVERGSIKLDLYRRDFSVNALAIRLNPGLFGQVVDFFGGQRDLKERTIRILHNLSFVDDPTRIIRAVRFEQKFGFKIGKHTQYLLKGAVRNGYLARAQGHRTFSELMAILKEARPERAFERMNQLGILPAIHPALAFDRKISENFEQVEKIHTWYGYLYLEKEPDISDIYFNTILLLRPTVARDEIMEVFQIEGHRQDTFRGRWSKITSTLKALAREDEPSIRHSRIARLLADLTTEDLLIIMALTKREGTARAVSLYLSRLRAIKSELDGKILQAMGYESGPIFRSILQAAQDARVDGEVKTLAEEKAWVKNHFPST
ncbi:multifunctional CCA protein [bacterium BMS3Abin14]|nr:multifunctional CCA protein [bacterium BMS3Abin14]